MHELIAVFAKGGGQQCTSCARLDLLWLRMLRHAVSESARRFGRRVGARDAIDGEQPFGGVEQRDVAIDDLDFPLPPAPPQRFAKQPHRLDCVVAEQGEELVALTTKAVHGAVGGESHNWREPL